MDFALQGFSLALCDCEASALVATVDECFNAAKFSPFKVSAFDCQLYNEASVRDCAEEVFEAFGRIDVLCFVDKRYETSTMMHYTTIFYLNDQMKPPAKRPIDFDFSLMLNYFYPLLKAEKPKQPKLPLHLSSANRRRGYPKPIIEEDSDEDSIDEEEEDDLGATSLLLFVSTPDSTVCRAGRNHFTARAHQIENLVAGINAEAVARRDPIRACTAIVGTLHGEVPFWQRRRREEVFAQVLQKQQMGDQNREDPTLSSPSAAPSRENSPKTSSGKRLGDHVQAMFSKHVMKRKASRSRGLVLRVEEIENEENDEIPFLPQHHQEAERLTSESLSCAEASAWVIWGLTSGRFRIVVGYDLLLLESAWLPNAFLNRLFVFAGAGGRRNLLPVRTRALEIAANKYDADRLWRHRTRQVIAVVVVVFTLFTPVVAFLMCLALGLWSFAVLSREGHTVTERAVSSILFVVSFRRHSTVVRAVHTYQRIERTVLLVVPKVEKVMIKAWCCFRPRKRRMVVG